MGGKSPAALERGDHPKIGSAVRIVNCLLFICFFLNPAKQSCCKCFGELVLDWDLRANHCPSVTVQKVLKASLIRKLREALSWILWSINFSSPLASILHKSLRQTEMCHDSVFRREAGVEVSAVAVQLFLQHRGSWAHKFHTLVPGTQSDREQSHWFSFDPCLGLCPCPSQNPSWGVRGCVRWTRIFQRMCLPSRGGKMKSCQL